MVRTQVQFTEEQQRLLRATAGREGVSISEVVRRCVTRSLRDAAPERAEQYRRATELIGRFNDRHGAKDLSARHDDYLEEAFR